MSNKIIINKAEFKSYIEDTINTTLTEEKIIHDCEIYVNFIDDRKIRRINKEQRGKDTSTDVLSFPLVEMENLKYLKLKTGRKRLTDCINYENSCISLGEICISTETARRQAKQFGQSVLRETVFLTIHSMLHLLGYDHMESGEELTMRKKQRKILRILEKNGKIQIEKTENII